MVQEDEGEEKKGGQVVIYMVDRRQIQGTRRRETDRYKKTFGLIWALACDTIRNDMWTEVRHAVPGTASNITLYVCSFYFFISLHVSRGSMVGVR